jgi:hypothetical protein
MYCCTVYSCTRVLVYSCTRVLDLFQRSCCEHKNHNLVPDTPDKVDAVVRNGGLDVLATTGAGEMALSTDQRLSMSWG